MKPLSFFEKLALGIGAVGLYIAYSINHVFKWPKENTAQDPRLTPLYQYIENFRNIPQEEEENEKEEELDPLPAYPTLPDRVYIPHKDYPIWEKKTFVRIDTASGPKSKDIYWVPAINTRNLNPEDRNPIYYKRYIVIKKWRDQIIQEEQRLINEATRKQIPK